MNNLDDEFGDEENDTPDPDFGICPNCNGEGIMLKFGINSEDDEEDRDFVECEVCGGSGEIYLGDDNNGLDEFEENDDNTSDEN